MLFLLVMPDPSLFSPQDRKGHIVGQLTNYFGKLLGRHLVALDIIDGNNVIGTFETRLGKDTIFVDRLDTKKSPKPNNHFENRRETTC